MAVPSRTAVQPLATDNHAWERLAREHARFARAAVAIYASAALVSLLLVGGTLISEFVRQKTDANANLLMQTELKAHYFEQHLALLARELARLGLRSEVDLLDRNMEPERSLLALSHRKSAFFNTGVAIISKEGEVAWAEPQDFAPVGKSFAREPWFTSMESHRGVRTVPVDPERETDALIYVVSPIVRDGHVVGALLGAVDLAKDATMESATEAEARATVQSILATKGGSIVYPPKPQPFGRSDEWHRFIAGLGTAPHVATVELSGVRTVAASAEVLGSDLLLLSVADRDALYEVAQARLVSGMGLELGLAILPLALLILLLRRSLGSLRRSEADALREERLVLLGEAVNVIAHEVKNSLNSLRLGLDLVLAEGSGPRRDQALPVVRAEIERLADFSQDLLTFSRGIELHPVAIDVVDLIPTVVELLAARAVELGVTVDVDAGRGGVARAHADPKYIRVVLSNLAGNALDALATSASESRRLELRVTVKRGELVVEVSDNGPGVPAAIRPRLFEPFVTGKPNGVGIGLALSRRIARAHGGDLLLVPTAVGATFALHLPLAPSDKESS